MATIKKIILAQFIFFLTATPLFADSKPLYISANLVAGYDNNVFLNADRKGDGFAQEYLNVEYRTPLYAKLFRLRFSYEALNNNYFEFTTLNYLSQDLGVGLDYRVWDGTWIQLDYDFIYTDFFDYDALTTLNHRGRIGLAQKISDTTSLRLGYRVALRDFDEREPRLPDGYNAIGDERSDDKQELEAELYFRFPSKAVARLGASYLLNDSNDQFHDYYDYASYKLYLSAAAPVCKSWTLLGRLSYQNDDYDSRPLLDNHQNFQQDDIYRGSIGLSKKLCDNVSVTGLYSYRQKVSNERSQSYSGSIITLGLYVSF